MGNFPKVNIKIGDITLEGWHDADKGFIYLEGGISIKIQVTETVEAQAPPSTARH